MLLLNLNKEAVETETPAPAPEPREPLIECFDVAHYRAQLTAASVAIPEGVDLIDFYKQTLEVRLFSPNDVFDENYYLSYYDDVRAAVRSGEIDIETRSRSFRHATKNYSSLDQTTSLSLIQRGRHCGPMNMQRIRRARPLPS
jgi:hypothetical protein